MKQWLLSTLVITLTAAGASAQFIDQGGGAQAEMVKQRALKTQDANNANQAATAAAAGGGAAPAASAPIVTAPPVEVIPGPRTISAAQQQNLDKLDADLAAVKPGSDVSDDQKHQVQVDFLALSKGGTKPSRAALTKLSGDLAAALTDKGVSFKDQSDAFIKNINILLNSGRMTPDELPDFIHAAEHSLESSGVSAENVQKVSADLKAITRELQRAKPKLFQ